jgi:ketosteroid isomerase-like protein
MYKALIRRQVRKAYGNLRAGDYDKVVDRFGPDSIFCMEGDHPLGGENRGREAIRDWFRRAWELFPDLRLEPHEILVNGGPWNIRVATHFTVTASLPDGSTYRNEGMQFLKLRGPSVVEDRLYEDTKVLAEAIETASRASAPRTASDPVSAGS